MTERLIGVGVLGYQRRVEWRSPDLPAPTIIVEVTQGRRNAAGEPENGGSGWILVERVEDEPCAGS